MAIGDITSCTVLSTGDEVDVVFDGLATGLTKTSGLTGANIPGASTPYLDVTSEGYDAAGNLGTTTRRVYLMKTARKPYPDQATEEESGTLTVRFVLSDAIHNDDTGVTLTAPSGWLTGSNAATALACTNNSTLDYPKVIARWAWPGFDRVTTSLTVERLAFHKYGQNKKPVACVVFTCTDGTTTLTQTVTAMTKPTREDIQLGVYEATFDLSTLSDGVLTVNAVAYPWVGDANSVRTTVGGTAQPATTDGPLKFLKGGTESIAYVDRTLGNNATAVINDPTKPYANVQSAVDGIGAANTANSRDGGRVRLRGFVTAKRMTLTTTNTHLVIEPDYDAGYTKATAGFDEADGAGEIHVGKLKFSDITINNSAATNSSFWQSAATHAWLDNVALVRGEGKSNAILWDFASLAVTRSSVTGGGLGFNTNAWALTRGNTYLTPGAEYKGACSLGNIGGGIFLPELSFHENGVCYGNKRFGCDTSSNAVATASIDLTSGFAFVGNLVEVTTGGNPAIACYADSNNRPAEHLIFEGNTIAGERCNMGYVSSTAAILTNWRVSHNAMQWWPSKHDINGTDGTLITGWSVMNEVGCFGNHSEYGGTNVCFDLARIGVNSTYAPSQGSNSLAGYVDDKSVFGAGGGSGDYTPDTDSVLRGKILSGKAMIPFDFAGTAIGSAGGAIQPASTGSGGNFILGSGIGGHILGA